MIGARWTCLALLAVALSGCTDNGGSPPEATNPDGTPTGTAPEHVLDFAPVDFSATQVLEGTFAFEDNQQYHGELNEHLGRNPDAVRQFHDIGQLLPDSGLYRLTYSVRADPGDGDIDAWPDGEGVLSWFCECPFGGNIDVIVYGNSPGDVSIVIQYDEVQGDDTDTNWPTQGFDYTIEVLVESLSSVVPPGVPAAVRLEAGDVVSIENHSAPVTVFDPDDIQIAVLEGEDNRFNATRGGEFVFIQQLDGALATLVVARETPPQARLLRVEYAEGEQDFAPGAPMSLPFSVGPGTIDIGACGVASQVTADREMRITDPAGEIWSHTVSSGAAVTGWATCDSTWTGAPNILVGDYTISLTQTPEGGGNLFWWVGSYTR